MWAVDFVKTKDGHFDNYLQYIAANWSVARKEAKARNYIVASRMLVLPSNPDWDVLLMTEYADMQQFEMREENFKNVFKEIRRDQGPLLINGLGSKDLAEIKFSETFTGIPHDGQ